MPSESQPLLTHDDGAYLREECDHLLLAAARNRGSEENLPLEAEGLLGNPTAAIDEEPPFIPQLSESSLRSQRRKASFIRVLALLCTCSLSIGSH